MKKIVFILLVCLILPAPSIAAVGFDAASECDADCDAPSTSDTWAHAVGSTGTILLVGGNVGGQTLTGTYAGAALTAIFDTPSGSTSTCVRCSLFYKVSPATGSNDIVMSRPGSDNAVFTAISLNGSLTDASVLGIAASTSCSGCTATSKAFTTLHNDSMVTDNFTFNSGNQAGIAATGPDQTLRISDVPFADVNSHASTQPVPVAGSSTIAYSWTSSSNVFLAITEVKTAEGAAPAAASVIRRIYILD